MQLLQDRFKEQVYEDVLAKVRAAFQPDIERIAREHAAQVTECIVTYYKDHRMMEDWLDWRIRINSTEVKNVNSNAA